MNDLTEGQKVRVKISNGEVMECLAKGRKAAGKYEELYPTVGCLDKDLLVIVPREACCEWECQLLEVLNESN